MVSDVAKRDLDQAGFRIANIGEPKKGDATRTDNESKPKPNAGSGSPGSSFLAAPADHVHPASPGGGGSSGTVDISDPTEQKVTGTDEQLVSEHLVQFQGLGDPRMTIALGAIGKVSSGRAEFWVAIGGTPGKPDGKRTVGSSINSDAFEKVGASGGTFETPAGLELVKMVVKPDKADAVCHIKTKSIALIGGSPEP
jgi:hypothetical protein